jgi:hypothetical protein
MNVYTFKTQPEAIEFVKQARKTQKEDSSRYSIEITNMSTVEEAIGFLDSVNGRIDEQRKVSNYV